MKQKMFIPLVIATIFLITLFSGCIYTLGWTHANEEGTAIQMAGKLSSFFDMENWEVGFVYDSLFHSRWNQYENYIVADDFDVLNTFYATLSGLERNQTIHFRAIAHLRVPNPRTIQSFDFELKPGQPAISTHEPTEIEIDAFTMNGELYHLGGAPNCEVWFQYGISENDLDNSTPSEIFTEPNTFNFTLDDLVSGTTFYYRAYAKNDIDTVYGVTQTVTPGGPTVSTDSATDIGVTYATLNGELLSMGGTEDCDVWFEYGLSGNELTEITPTQTLDSIGEFNAKVSGLSGYTTYYFRAVADNGIIRGYGSIYSFETSPTGIMALKAFS